MIWYSDSNLNWIAHLKTKRIYGAKHFLIFLSTTFLTIWSTLVSNSKIWSIRAASDIKLLLSHTDFWGFTILSSFCFSIVIIISLAFTAKLERFSLFVDSFWVFLPDLSASFKSSNRSQYADIAINALSALELMMSCDKYSKLPDESIFSSILLRDLSLSKYCAYNFSSIPGNWVKALVKLYLKIA